MRAMQQETGVADVGRYGAQMRGETWKRGVKGARGGGGVLISCMDVVELAIHRPSHPHHARTEHVGLSPTRQASRAPSANSREGSRRVA